MKKLSVFIVMALLTGMFFTSCVKDRNEGPDFSSTDPVLELRTPVNDIAGLTYFSRAVIGNFPTDTVQFYVNLASAATLNTDLNVTIGVDADRLDTYNGDSANAVKYELLPDSTYTILKTAGTIVSGSRIDSFQVVFHRDRIDPVTNYMLPIAITEGNNILISQNQGVIWFHAIGNPLAGTYLQDFYRWNDVADTTGPPNSTVFEDEAAAVPPEDATTLFLPESYLQTFTGGGISLSFTNTNGELSNFDVSLNQDTQDGLETGGFIVLTQPILVSYTIVGDASTKYVGSTFRTYMVVKNSSGGIRLLVDEFTKQ